MPRKKTRSQRAVPEDDEAAMTNAMTNAIDTRAEGEGGTHAVRGSAANYRALVAEALELVSIPSRRTPEALQRAEENLRQAIALCPERRDAHGIYAQPLIVHHHDQAIEHFMRVVELSTQRDELWAKAFVSCFLYFHAKRHEASGFLRPAWFNDATLREAAVEAKAVLPDYEWRAVRAHAIIMSAPIYPWCTWPLPDKEEGLCRTAEEFVAAAESFQSIVKMVGQARKGIHPGGVEDATLLKLSDDDLKTHITLAVSCRRAAEAAAAADAEARDRGPASHLS